MKIIAETPAQGLPHANGVMRLKEVLSQGFGPIPGRAERRDKHGGKEISLHQTDAGAPQLVVAVTTGFDEQEESHEEHIEEDDAVVALALAKGDRNGGSGGDHGPICGGI